MFLSIIAGFSTVIGCLPIFVKIKRKNAFISFFMGISISIIVLISIIELFIPASISIIANNSRFNSYLIILIIVTLGFIVSKVISKWVSYYNQHNSLLKLGIINMIVMILHNFPEGIITFITSYYVDYKAGLRVAVAIMLHNIPEGFSISIPLFYSGKKKSRVVIATLISGLAEPLGALLTYLVLNKYISLVSINYILIYVSSIMIYMAIKEIYPEANKLKEYRALCNGLITGIILFVCLELFL